MEWGAIFAPLASENEEKYQTNDCNDCPDYEHCLVFGFLHFCLSGNVRLASLIRKCGRWREGGATVFAECGLRQNQLGAGRALDAALVGVGLCVFGGKVVAHQ